MYLWKIVSSVVLEQFQNVSLFPSKYPRGCNVCIRFCESWRVGQKSSSRRDSTAFFFKTTSGTGSRGRVCVWERGREREKERGGERNRRKFSLRCTATMCPPSENIQKRRTDKLSARRPTFEGQRETSRRYTVNTGSDDDVEPALLQEPVTPRFFLFSPSACFDLLVPWNPW